MWVVGTYKSTALFSLKPATATASGGRTLLVPTPYAVKMALLDVACRLVGQATAAEHWDNWLGECVIALRPAEFVVVNNTFIKILRKKEFKAKGNKDQQIAEAKVKKQYPFYETIAYREYAQLGGDFGIAVEVQTNEHANLARRWLAHVNYLGKRGSFIQIQHAPTIVDDLSDDFIRIDGELSDGFALDAVLTQLDDTGEKATFEYVSIYSGKRMNMGKQRVLHHVALPYERVRSSRSYTFYRKRTGNTP